MPKILSDMNPARLKFKKQLSAGATQTARRELPELGKSVLGEDEVFRTPCTVLNSINQAYHN
jgi:hypothetical protein